MSSKSYSKREIIDNSHRYIENREEDVVVRAKTIGDSLLASAGDGSSHMRLNDEILWNDDGISTLRIDSIDCNDLNKALSCIPMNIVLDCPAGVLSESEVEHFAEEARINRLNYKPNRIIQDNCKSDVELKNLTTLLHLSSSDSSAVKVNMNPKEYQHIITDSSVTEEDDLLNALLNTKIDSNFNNPKPSSIDTNAGPTDHSGDDLEDWLQSVLGE